MVQDKRTAQTIGSDLTWTIAHALELKESLECHSESILNWVFNKSVVLLQSGDYRDLIILERRRKLSLACWRRCPTVKSRSQLCVFGGQHDQMALKLHLLGHKFLEEAELVRVSSVQPVNLCAVSQVTVENITEMLNRENTFVQKDVQTSPHRTSKVKQ